MRETGVEFGETSPHRHAADGHAHDDHQPDGGHGHPHDDQNEAHVGGHDGAREHAHDDHEHGHAGDEHDHDGEHGHAHRSGPLGWLAELYGGHSHGAPVA